MKDKQAEPQPRVFGYCRVSTGGQDVENQKRIISEYLRFKGMDLTEFYSDVCSAKHSLAQRPAGRELLATVRKDDIVVITALDRAFRRTIDCLTVLENWQAKGVKLHVINLGGNGASVDMSSPIGRFMLQIMAGVAELERSYISERTKAAGSRRAIVGCKKVRIKDASRRRGYRVIFVPDPEQREAAKRAAIIYGETGSLSATCRQLMYEYKRAKFETPQSPGRRIKTWIQEGLKFIAEDAANESERRDA